MAGSFELFADEESHVRFRLVAPDGTVLVVSGQYGDKRSAAAAIKEVRECAGMGLIQDRCPKPVPVAEDAQHAASHRMGQRAAL